MECSFLAGDTLDDKARVLINKNAQSSTPKKDFYAANRWRENSELRHARQQFEVSIV
jgi:hypothetical protein